MTPQQAKLLSFIDGYTQNHGFCPSYAEMMGPAGQKSKAGVARIVGELIEAGKLRRHAANRARALDVVRQGDPLAAAAPKLLEALKNAIALWSYRSTDDEQRAWLDEARAAIAKAEGEV